MSTAPLSHSVSVPESPPLPVALLSAGSAYCWDLAQGRSTCFVCLAQGRLPPSSMGSWHLGMCCRLKQCTSAAGFLKFIFESVLPRNSYATLILYVFKKWNDALHVNQLKFNVGAWRGRSGLAAHTALAEDLLGPRAPVSSNRRSHSLLRPPWTPAHTCVYTHRQQMYLTVFVRHKMLPFLNVKAYLPTEVNMLLCFYVRIRSQLKIWYYCTKN